MTTCRRVVIMLLFYSSMLFVRSACADATFIIVRHGEKPAQGLGQLSCQGLNRALALPRVLLSRYGDPVAIYAPNPAIQKFDKGVPYAYVRPLATIEPLAIRAGLPVNVNFGMTDIAALARQLLTQNEGTFVVAWEHHYAEKLAKHLLAALGVSPAAVPTWGDMDFDSIYVIRTTGDASGKRQATFTHEHEELNDLPETCAE